MAEAEKVGEWSETLPKFEIRKSKPEHEFSGLVSNIIKDIGVKEVIDFGCGDGSLCQIFDSQSYLGLDIDDKILNLAKSHFGDYVFNKSNDSIYSTDMCIASRVFNEISDKKLNDLLFRMRCKWLLVAEPLNANQDGNVYSFNQRSREDYVSLMRSHDLLLFKHMVKSLKKESPEDVSFLLFKKCERNPIKH